MNVITIENKDFLLKIRSDGSAESLIHKATGRECLDLSTPSKLFSITQDRPFNNEIKLAYCNKRTEFEATSVRRDGDKLIIGFDKVLFQAVVTLKITDSYVSFTLSDYIIPECAFRDLCMTPPPITEFRLMKLNLKKLKNFGQWLNVMWDDQVAVNLLATSPYERIDSEKTPSGRALTADAVRGIKLLGAGTALIVSSPDTLLDRIDALEKDYGLPKGVEARRGKYINTSSYWVRDLNPSNLDRHIAYCKAAGMKLMLIYYKSIFVEERGYRHCGDYFLQDCYNGTEGLKAMLDKIRAAGIKPGIHFLHSHIGIKTAYVTPKADPRLNKTILFTLTKDLDEKDDVIYVDRSPEFAPMHPQTRVLHFDNELISYESYTTTPPYRFEGCKRGHWDTEPQAHKAGTVGGISDVSEYGATSIYIDQNTDLQDEVGKKLADVYNLGFEFVYYDGSEGVNVPYEFHVPNAQYRVYKLFEKEPLFCEGAAKSHFGWHILSGGNAFDMDDKNLVPTEEMLKPMIAKFPLNQAPHTAKDFTRLNFGWWDYFKDNQPDSFEYGTCRAASWGCPVIMKGVLEAMDANPRTADVLETMKRWEQAREQSLFTDEQMLAMRDPDREFHLLRLKDGSLKLTEYFPVTDARSALRAFVFTEGGYSYAVMWHRTDKGILKLSIPDARLLDSIDGEETAICENGFILENRVYLKTSLSKEELSLALKNACLD
ncbi:MAG: hypothetical protein E7646_07725 [Ruminococcaceae bacterium]|nr:hypothetical protein [Oscillospiraceae bacterium]